VAAPAPHVARLVVPALLDRFAHTFRVLLAVLLVQIRGFDIRGRRGIGVIEQTASISFGFTRKAPGKVRCNVPLNARQDGGHVVGRRPPVLQNIQTKLSRTVYIGVEHDTDELDAWWLIWVGLLKVHN